MRLLYFYLRKGEEWERVLAHSSLRQKLTFLFNSLISPAGYFFHLSLKNVIILPSILVSNTYQ